MSRISKVVCWVVLAAVLAGCASHTASSRVRLREVRRLPGFQVPECVLPDVATGALYVSNIEAVPGEYWADDGRGFVTRIDPAGVCTERWLNSVPDAVLNSPKGMCLLQGRLYFTDNRRLLSCDAVTGGGLTVVAEGFLNANDLATDGSSVWLSDSAAEAGRVWCIAPDGSSRRQVPAPARVNGLAFHLGRLYAVSWDLHEVYELDPSGQAAAQPFGLAQHFTNLDGIEILADGTFLVSDFGGNQVCAISPDRRRVRTLARVTAPADLGLDRGRGLLYVPSFLGDEVVVFALR